MSLGLGTDRGEHFLCLEKHCPPVSVGGVHPAHNWSKLEHACLGEAFCVSWLPIAASLRYSEPACLRFQLPLGYSVKYRILSGDAQ